MGENQGMIWIILGVIIVGAVIITLGTTMGNSVEDSNNKIADQTGQTETP